MGYSTGTVKYSVPGNSRSIQSLRKVLVSSEMVLSFSCGNMLKTSIFKGMPLDLTASRLRRVWLMLPSLPDVTKIKG